MCLLLDTAVRKCFPEHGKLSKMISMQSFYPNAENVSVLDDGNRYKHTH